MPLTINDLTNTLGIILSIENIIECLIKAIMVVFLNGFSLCN